MYPNNPRVLQLAALMRAHGIDQVVISPGSRNAPLIHTFANMSAVTCHRLIDERSAAFYALGLAEAKGKPVALCCTSGSAVLNYAPAVAEASLRRIPLLLITADRPRALIGQMDGQTLPQEQIFGSLVSYSCSLPEGESAEDQWHANRLINEALIALFEKVQRPVHINVPLREPLFDFSVKELAQERLITRPPYRTLPDTAALHKTWRRAGKKLIIVGQHTPDDQLTQALSRLASDPSVVILSEMIGNCLDPSIITSFDALLYASDDKSKELLLPEIVITLGGHVISKRLKQWLRQAHHLLHWHLDPCGEMPDLYFQMSESVRGDEIDFLTSLPIKAPELGAVSYLSQWQSPLLLLQEATREAHLRLLEEKELTDLYVTAHLAAAIPQEATLHLGNSSSVRHMQLFSPRVAGCFCNRGVSGIEGSLSTAIGYSMGHGGDHYLLLGDLSFFYDMSALAVDHISRRMKVLMINNRGGALFHQLPGLDQSNALSHYVAHHHQQDAEGWCRSAGWCYLSAKSREAFEEAMPQFLSQENSRPIFFEVFTDIDLSTQSVKRYYQTLKMSRS